MEPVMLLLVRWRRETRLKTEMLIPSHVSIFWLALVPQVRRK